MESPEETTIMDTTPPPPRPEPRKRTKSSSKRSKFRQINDEQGESQTPKVDVEVSPSAPNQELLLLSPSPDRRTKTHVSDNLEMADDGAEPVGIRRRRRGRNATAVCASPRNNRRLRKRLDQEMAREDKDSGFVEEAIKPRKKRQIGRSKKEKLSIVPALPSSPKSTEIEGVNLDRIGELISDLLMWRDVARSSLWFGFGSLCFLSSCFATGINISIFSVISQMGLFFLAVSFILNTLRPRQNAKIKTEMKLNEEDILRICRFILPAVNLGISKTRDLFSGEPAMTLKVVPFLLVGAEYGHMLTLWRLCALVFFVGFTAPRLYSSYSTKICRNGERMRCLVMEAWGACSHKKIIAAAALSGFWNLTTVRTRFVAALICVAVIRHYRMHSRAEVEEVVVEQEEEEAHEQHEEQQENEQKEVIAALESESHK